MSSEDVESPIVLKTSSAKLELNVPKGLLNEISSVTAGVKGVNGERIYRNVSFTIEDSSRYHHLALDISDISIEQTGNFRLLIAGTSSQN